MRIELAVELYGTRVGVLRGDDWRTADLTFDAAALERWGVNSPVLSVAAPLTLRPRRTHADRRRNVLAEVLPEGPMRDRLARMAGVSPRDEAGLLARFGRDVAGALQIYDPRSPWEPPTPALNPVDDEAIAALIDDVALGNHPRAGKTSLAGVQPKLVLTRAEGAWFQPIGGAPSTHIVKPALPGRESEPAEEEFGQRLARRLGLCDNEVRLALLGGRECLVIERFDRIDGQRLHQEDFNQALGLAGDAKYQEYGGHARMLRVAEVVRQFAPADLGRLAAHLTLAVAIGNLDLHAKNLGLLHPADGSTALAPAYDMVPMAHRKGIDGRLAMAVAGEYWLSAITREHLEREVTSWGGEAQVVGETLERIRDLLPAESPQAGREQAATRIADAVERLLASAPIAGAFTH
ncbi:MAG: HipA domain-containing protein [Dermatophilus congolensis]|nr:HipA domain-containing protein [Dermatophilus congolensis]